MKKFGLTLIFVVLIALGAATLASANGGPHGGYSATTDACAGCHQAHTASGPKLLREASTFDLCMSCHGNSAAGAVTNVSDGVLEASPGDNTGTLLNGGGFTYISGTLTTSTHDVTETITDPWGNGVARGSKAALAGGDALNCASCHDPHGSTNYRILRTTVNGNPVTVTQVDEGAQVYDSEDWGDDISNICAACHEAYHDNAGAFGGGNTHEVDMNWNDGNNVNPETIGFGGYFLPLADTGGTDIVACTTCHISHGSSAAMSGFADGGPSGTGVPPGETTATDSALLRLDNRGVCEVCHQK